MQTDPRPTLHPSIWGDADRLTGGLMRAFEVGVRVDPLVPSLRHLTQEVHGEIMQLPNEGGHPSRSSTHLRQTLERLISDIEKLLNTALADRF